MRTFLEFQITEKQLKGEEETDDVLDLEVTDALDDLETEEENSQSKSNNETSQGNKLSPSKHIETISEKTSFQRCKQKTFQLNKKLLVQPVDTNFVKQTNVDLREKLLEKVINHQKDFVENNQQIKDTVCEENKEKRNRFQNERVTFDSKFNQRIPDSLENISTLPNRNQHYKNHGVNNKNDLFAKSRVNPPQSHRVDKFDQRFSRGKNNRRYESYSVSR